MKHSNKKNARNIPVGISTVAIPKEDFMKRKAVLAVIGILILPAVVFSQDYNKSLVALVRIKAPEGRIIAISPSNQRVIDLVENVNSGEIRREGRVFFYQASPRYNHALSSFELSIETNLAQVEAATTTQGHVEKIFEGIIADRYLRGDAATEAAINAAFSIYTANAVNNLQREAVIHYCVTEQPGKFIYGVFIIFSFPVPDKDDLLAILTKDAEKASIDTQKKPLPDGSLFRETDNLLNNNQNLLDMRERRNRILNE